MLERIDTIQRDLHGLDRADFMPGSMVVDAVLHDHRIIGETASHVPVEIVARHPDVRWRPVRGMHNVLAHRYFGVDLDSALETLADDLSELRTRLQELLREVSPDQHA